MQMSIYHEAPSGDEGVAAPLSTSSMPSGGNTWSARCSTSLTKPARMALLGGAVVLPFIVFMLLWWIFGTDSGTADSGTETTWPNAYIITGCQTPDDMWCGTFQRVTANCVSTVHPHCGADPTMCDEAPVYQNGDGGPVLFRWAGHDRKHDGESTYWYVSGHNVAAGGSVNAEAQVALESCNTNFMMYWSPRNIERPDEDDGATKNWYGGTGWTAAWSHAGCHTDCGVHVLAVEGH